MKRLASIVLWIGVLTLPAALAAEDENLPVATEKRIVLHGVDCPFDSGQVCDDEAPLFDEAAALIDEGSAVCLSAGDVGAEHTLALDAAEAAKDYFVTTGVIPERIGVCSIDLSAALPSPIEVRLVPTSQ